MVLVNTVEAETQRVGADGVYRGATRAREARFVGRVRDRRRVGRLKVYPQCAVRRREAERATRGRAG